MRAEVFGNGQRTGEPLLGAPEVSASLSGGYEHRLSSRLNGFARIDASYRSTFNVNPNFDPRSEQDAVTLLNAQAGLRAGNQGWRLSLWGRNLLNETYSVADITTPLTTSGISSYLNEPRTYGVTLQGSF